jgi:hypothetical protein
MKKKSDKLRDMETPMVLGYELDRKTLTPSHRTLPPRVAGKDYGCDPVGDGTYKMVPSGDVVSREEKEKRLGR